MKKTTISISAAVLGLAFSLYLSSCSEGKKEAAATDSISVEKDTMMMDSTSAPSSSRMTDTTDTGGRNTQAPRPKN
jgi:hypothetical protein